MLASRRKHYLADEPGLGKSCTALTAAKIIGAQRIAVIAPAIVRPHWHREAALLGVGLAFVESYNAITGSDYLQSLAARADLLLVDESHFCKHQGSRRTRVIFGRGGLSDRVLDAGGRVWPMSGTPMPRNPAELYPVLHSLWPKTLQNIGITSYTGWLNHFCRYRVGRYGVKVYGAQNIPQLRELLSKVMLRRLTREVAPDLPPLRWGQIDIELPSIAEVLLAEADLPPETRAALEAGELPPMSPQLARYRHQVGDLKAPVAAELIRDELDAEPELSKKVVFAYHRSVLDRLEVELQDYGVTRIDGNVPPMERERRLRRFETVPAQRVFLGQIEACAVGLDGLQYVAHDAIMVEPDWKTDYNVQAAKRLARMGQTTPVQTRILSIAGTLDTTIIRNHEREIAMVASVTG